MTTRGERRAALLVSTVFVIFAVGPVIGIILVAVRPAGDLGGGIDLAHGFDLSNFGAAWDLGGFAQSLRSSLIVVASVVPTAATLSVLAGYAFGKMRFRLAPALFGVFLIGLMMPVEATIIPLYFALRGFGLTNTYWALFFPLVAQSLPFGVFWMRASFKALPDGLLEAARLDGATNFQILRMVALPIAAPAIFTMVVLFFMWAWNDFLIALVMVSRQELRTAPLSITFFVGQHVANLSLVAAASILVATPVLVAYIVFQRQFIRGVLAGALRE